MINLSTATKKHYLIKTMQGFENIFRTRITSIESYSNDPDMLYIYMYVNPTMDQYTDVQRVETTVKYNLLKDSFTIKCEGKGAKKYNKQIKYDVTGIIENLVKEAIDYFTGDQAESLFLTQQYYYDQLKTAGANTALLNQFHYDTNHTYNTIEEMQAAVNAILVSLQPSVNNQTSEETTVNYTVGSRSFTSYDSALQYCNESEFDPDLMLIEEVATMQPSQDIPDNEEYYLYKNTFTTYSDAYNYAIKYSIPVTMIISNKHPYMTNERLQELEKEYVFNKINMSYEDIQEYYKYISDQPISLDREDRYYKLKSYIQRYEYRQQQREAAQQEQKRKAVAIDQMLKDLYNIGMTKQETKTLVQYFLNGEKIYQWFSGITIEKLYDELIPVHDKHYKRLQAV